MTNNKQILIYQTDGKTHIDVQLKNETVWLSLSQMAELFERDKSVISRHLNRIFAEGELERRSTVAYFATVQVEGERNVQRTIEYYNLDAIISLGYRVNSKRGVQFRQWATQKLKDYLVQGYALNQKKITEKGLTDIQKTLGLLSKTLQSHAFIDEKGAEVLSLILSYAKTWNLLFQYDDHGLSLPETCVPSRAALDYEEAFKAIQDLKVQLIQCKEATTLFGQQKAAHLLYFVIKDHPFSDGNKRIGTLLFLMYLQKQGMSLASLPNSALVALALLVAESNPLEKDLMFRLIVNLLVPS